ncbi:chemotaxis protein CheD [Halotalea alkalilenta]|uniref:chemotaxis protein CheD n=1 Tax=Halotalea alkalilenta TaxID=376489 RepID=UPI0006946D4F|nr:chemotaxis protein CheD [Halotalea alkalilenta]
MRRLSGAIEGVELDGWRATHRYYEPLVNAAAVKLLPGEYYVSVAGEPLCTVLGSCVALCLFDPVTKVAAMNHFLLPGDAPLAVKRAHGMRYGNTSCAVLIATMVRAGARPDRLEAKLFGGASGLTGVAQSVLRVGELNARCAEAFVAAHGLRLVASDLEGRQARRVLFDTESGRVRVRRLGVREGKIDQVTVTGLIEPGG